jgi:hypothetical protein
LKYQSSVESFPVTKILLQERVCKDKSVGLVDTNKVKNVSKTESIDSEKWLFDYKLQEHRDKIPNLISRRQFNDRKKPAGLCEEIRKRLAFEMDGGEEHCSHNLLTNS